MSIRIRQWKDMERWDWVLRSEVMSTARAGETATIGEFLIPRREVVDRAKVSFSELQPISIHFDGSISRRQLATGHEYSLPMLWVRTGDIVLSKIDLKNGAVTVLPEDWGDAAVTTHFAVYQPDRGKIDPRFFKLLIQTPPFKDWLQSNKTGHDGRTEVKLTDFEDLEIPLPKPSEQSTLLDAYDNEVRSARAIEVDAQLSESNSIRAFEAELGLTPPPNLPRKLLQIARFAEIDRWSHEGILDRRLLAAAGNGKERFPIVTLGDVIADLENGWSPQCLDRPVEADEWGVLKLGAVSFGEYDERENKALPSHLKPNPELEVKEGNILISRANVLRLVGACAIVRKTRPNLMLCDKIFRVVFLQDSPIDPDFLVEVLKLPSVRQQIETAATGTSPTMKNISKPSLLDLTFAVPQGPDGLKTQRNLVSKLRAARESSAARRKEAGALRAAAWSNFLNAVFL